VAVLGAFGIENFGNEATLDAAMHAVTHFVPADDIVCICSVPAYVSRRFGVAADHLHGPPHMVGRTAQSRRVIRTLARVRRVVSRFVDAHRQLRDVDIVLVAGTGALDDQHIGPAALPLDMAIWCLAARVAGARVAMLSVGAGPITSRASRLLLRSAAATAEYLSYRDQLSLDYMRSIGRNVDDDRVAPDLVLGRPPSRDVHQDGLAEAVAIGVMWSGNWSDVRQYEHYRSRLADLVVGLWQMDVRVVLMIGDRVDTESRDDLYAMLARIDGARTQHMVDVPAIDSFDDVLHATSRCDIAVVSRYHHVVAALLCSKPVVSLEYGFKNRALMDSVGLSDSCLLIDDFDATDVLQRVVALRERGHDQSVDRSLDRFRAQLSAQYANVLGARDSSRGEDLATAPERSAV
jgi:polysaccharide pyruvyl transferase WcaK-like protein